MASYIIKYPDDFRKKVAKRLTDLLDNDRHGINLEKGIFNFTIREAQYRKVIKKWKQAFSKNISIKALDGS